MTRFRPLLRVLRVLPLVGVFGCGAASGTAVGPNTARDGVAVVQHSQTTDSRGHDLVNASSRKPEVHDEHWVALQRMLTERWGRRPDRDDQLLVPLADAGNWKRVRYWLIDHFTGFRYGEDEIHAVNVVLVQDVETGVTPTAESCMKNAERWARPQMKAFDVRMGPIQSRKAEWRGTEVPVRTADALVDYGFGPMQFSAAWAAYPAYTNACLVFAFAVPWGEHHDLAQEVRERWIEDAVRKIKPLTEVRPYRKPHDDD